MSFDANVIFSAFVLAVVFPLGFVVLRRLLRGEQFDKTGTSTIMPPSGAPLDGS